MKSKITDKLFKQHILENTMLPGNDGQLWVAYIILSQKYPELTYWSWDGYSCDALADYSINLVWRDKEIIDWTTKQVIAITEKNFWETDTTSIVNTWMRMCGETTKTKMGWLLRETQKDKA